MNTLLSCVGVFLLAVVGTVQGGAMPEAMFIVDASGSMGGDAGGQTKMAAAKTVLKEVVGAVAPEVKIGLAVYGLLHERDCDDIQILVPPGQVDRSIVLKQIDGMQPVGMTPISKAILMVAESLTARDVETTIILVSDGRETCGGDPCEVVKALKKKGLRFVMHVVGFDVTDADKEQLACMATAGGGLLLRRGGCLGPAGRSTGSEPRNRGKGRGSQN